MQVVRLFYFLVHEKISRVCMFVFVLVIVFVYVLVFVIVCVYVSACV